MFQCKMEIITAQNFKHVMYSYLFPAKLWGVMALNVGDHSTGVVGGNQNQTQSIRETMRNQVIKIHFAMKNLLISKTIM